jgi:SAM-dependent methyltransferase
VEVRAVRNRTALALVAGGSLAALAVGAVASGVLIIPIGKLSSRRRRNPPGAPSSSGMDSAFTLYAPGGRWGFMFNGPIGRASTRYMPVMQAGMYQLVAQDLDLQPEDELLDIGCGPGAFLAGQAPGVRRVVGIDASPVMIRDAERRLADQLAAGTAQLVLGSAQSLPFGDGEFSAVSAISAPLDPAEVFRVLRPGGRVVCVLEIVPTPGHADAERIVVGPGWDEAGTRRAFEEAGFVVEDVRHKGYSFLGAERIVRARRPAAVPSSEPEEAEAAIVETAGVEMAAEEPVAVG